MPIFYSSLSRGPVILVDKKLGPEDYQSAARDILNNLSTDMNKKTSFPQDDILYHTMTDNGLVYLCCADKEMGRRIPYLCLDEVKQQFLSSASLVQRSSNAGQFEFNREFRQVLADILDKYNSGKGDQLSALQNQVGEVTGIMRQNVETVLERGEKLDDLVDKTEDLQNSATTFKVTSTKISRKMMWKNRKMMIIAVVVTLVVILIIVLIILSTTGVI
uniref:vesicle-associated membrane protein 7-like n=1 Tax=Styela clava TaxID=7725 RepID=UPI0019394E24|nr:vesicle-associated membrane protein 7-like [Styela clava]